LKSNESARTFFCVVEFVSMKYVGAIKPETVIKLYKKDGIDLTIEQAKAILEFMYMLAEISLELAGNKMSNKSDNLPTKFDEGK